MKFNTIAAIAAGLCLASCGNGAGKADGSGFKQGDVTRMTAVDGHKPDAEVMAARRISGTWTGRDKDRDIEASFGNKGEFSIRIMRKGSLVDAASGTYSWTDDGRIRGTASGGMKDLASYSTWNGAFPDPSTMSIAGSDGTRMTVTNPHGLIKGVAKDPAAVAAAAARGDAGPAR